MFLRNAGIHLKDYTLSRRRRPKHGVIHTHTFNKNCNTTQNLMKVQSISTTFGLSHTNFKHSKESEIS